MTIQTKTQMVGEAKLTLMAFTEKADQFKRLLDKNLVVDARINFLTVEGDLITVDVMEFLELNWTAYCDGRRIVRCRS